MAAHRARPEPSALGLPPERSMADISQDITALAREALGSIGWVDHTGPRWAFPDVERVAPLAWKWVILCDGEPVAEGTAWTKGRAWDAQYARYLELLNPRPRRFAGGLRALLSRTEPLA